VTTRPQTYASGTDRFAALVNHQTSRIEVLERLAPAVSDIEALQARVETLETQNAAQQASIGNLTTRVGALEARQTIRWAAGLATVTTGAEGKAVLTHNLGVQPTVVLATPLITNLGGGAILDIVAVDQLTPTTARLEFASNHGDWQNSKTLSCWWIAIAAG
jgi:hypothetical protein